MNCIRFLFCFYNFVFLVLGGAILGIGIWFAVDIQADGILKELLKKAGESDAESTTNIVETIRQASFVLIAFGGFIFLLSFLGYCGTIKESRFLLGFYSFLLTLILILEIVAVILIFIVYRPQIEAETQEILKENLIKRYGGEDTNLTALIDDFMIKAHCCGIYNGTDFKDSPPIKSQNYQVPKSCCKNQTTPLCMRNPTEEDSYYNVGCFQKLKDDLMTESGKITALAVGITIGILQLVGIVFSCWIYKEAKYSFA